jgi:uncharacterized membrane protein YkvA (DUF1232 family)
LFRKWKNWAKRLKIETLTLYLAFKDPRVPWYAKVVVACVVGYAFSPIDLIPDFIPVLGYIDDLILLPIGIMLALRMIPNHILAECKIGARKAIKNGSPVIKSAGIVILIIWIISGALIALFVFRLAKKS